MACLAVAAGTGRPLTPQISFPSRAPSFQLRCSLDNPIPPQRNLFLPLPAPRTHDAPLLSPRPPHACPAASHGLERRSRGVGAGRSELGFDRVAFRFAEAGRAVGLAEESEREGFWRSSHAGRCLPTRESETRVGGGEGERRPSPPREALQRKLPGDPSRCVAASALRWPLCCFPICGEEALRLSWGESRLVYALV